MKKVIYILAAAILLICFSSCQKLGDENRNTVSATDDIIETIAENTGENASVEIPEKIPQTENEIVYYSDREAAEILRDAGFSTSGDFLSEVPEYINHLSEFYIGCLPETSQREQLEIFCKVFSYFFPNHSLEDDCFFYQGPNSYIEYDKDHWQAGEEEPKSIRYFNKVSDFREQIESEEEKVNLFFYSEKEQPVLLNCSMPFGGWYCRINKGFAQKIIQSKNETAGSAYEFLNLSDYCGYIGSFAPDSEQAFKLTDKEISVKEASEFYESYVNGMPFMDSEPFNTVVRTVTVRELDKGIYAYTLIAKRQWEGIPFGETVKGERIPDNVLGSIMVESSDVDYFIDNIYAADTIMEKTDYTEIVSFEEASKICRSNMSDYVEFEVKSAHLAYIEEENIGTPTNVKYPVHAQWIFKLLNRNDGKNYVCHVNAKTGEFGYRLSKQ